MQFDDSILDLFTTTRGGKFPAKKKVTLVTLYFIFNWVYLIVSEWEFLSIFIQRGWYFDFLFSIAPIILIPIIIYSFWQRKKTGWMLIYGFLILQLIALILIFILTCIKYSKNYIFTFQETNHPVTIISIIVTYAIILWIITRQDVKALFYPKKSS